MALLIGYIEVVRQGIQSSSTNRNYLAALIVVAIIMVAINCAPGVLARTLWLRFQGSPVKVWTRKIMWWWIGMIRRNDKKHTLVAGLNKRVCAGGLWRTVWKNMGSRCVEQTDSDISG
ncbi:hypothetical protein AZF05_10290 [Corynebacterium diphtheriae bv. intermedius]|nr:hypothetical protein W5M_09866 [Corynebacterium diphtheriae bv. intermedius str. NCTC 5011]OWM38935.1 hypothetical protein AZF05_10290 [Corynebacterium diphtheriae bv. intermedius]